jgi:hypothetical protein
MVVEGGSGGEVVGADGSCAVLYRAGRCTVHRALAGMTGRRQQLIGRSGRRGYASETR